MGQYHFLHKTNKQNKFVFGRKQILKLYKKDSQGKFHKPDLLIKQCKSFCAIPPLTPPLSPAMSTGGRGIKGTACFEKINNLGVSEHSYSKNDLSPQ